MYVWLLVNRLQMDWHCIHSTFLVHMHTLIFVINIAIYGGEAKELWHSIVY